MQFEKQAMAIGGLLKVVPLTTKGFEIVYCPVEPGKLILLTLSGMPLVTDWAKSAWLMNKNAMVNIFHFKYNLLFAKTVNSKIKLVDILK